MDRARPLQILADLVERGELAGVLVRPYGLCRRLIGFDDYCQDVVLKAVRQVSGFRGNTKAELLAWIRAIGRQYSVDVLRRSAVRHSPELAENQEDTRQMTPLEELARDEQAARLLKCLESLDPFDLSILRGRYFEGKSFVEIAKDLGVVHNSLIQRHLRLVRRIGRKMGAGPP